MTGCRLISIALLIGSFLVSGAASQDKVITEKDFHAYLTASRAATGDVPFCRKETIETNYRGSGPWQLGGSSIQEAVPPDRFRTNFSSGHPRQSIHIGTTIYTEQPDGTWLEKSNVLGAIVSSPAVIHGFRGTVTFTESRSKGDTLTVTVVSKPEGDAGDNPKKAATYIYRFDRQGVLVEKDSISFTGVYWIKYAHKFEYDPTISIVAPRVN